MNGGARVELADFGSGGGVVLLAEYDAQSDTIRINARAVDRVRARAGTAEAELFVASAVAHECFHRARPHASEAAAHDHVRKLLGCDPRRFERFVRAAPRD